MASHVKALGILHIVFGILGILMVLFFLLFMGGLAALIGMTDDSEGAFLAMPILGGIGGIAFLFALLLSLPSIIGYRSAALQTVGASARNCNLSAKPFDVPFGTAFGIYGLWVLLSNQTARLFDKTTPVQVMRA